MAKKVNTKKARKKSTRARVGRTVKKKTLKRKVMSAPMRQKPVGVVTHYFSNIKVGIVKFKQPVKKGATVSFRGATTDFTQALDSMQYDYKAITVAPKGREVGIKVKKRVREGDELFLLA